MKKTVLFLFIFTLRVGFLAQSEIKNLVFEGAGIRGLAYAGALEVLEEKDLIKNIENVGGTSAGAITALMISLGYTSSEVNTIISSTDFGDFNDGEFLFVGGLYRIKNNFGWYKTDKFEDWLGEIIEAKSVNKNITFEGLSNQGFKNLYVTATCLNKQKVLVFSKDSYPKMKVLDAVKISMSVPIYFEVVFIDSLGTIHERTEDISNLDLVMDGGVIGNFPIDIFDRDTVVSEGKSVRIPNPNTLGFRIDSEEQIKYDEVNQELSPIEIGDIQDYMIAMYILVIENLNRNQLEGFDWDRTVSIGDADIGPKVKTLSKTQKEALLESGRKNTIDFFNKR